MNFIDKLVEKRRKQLKQDCPQCIPEAFIDRYTIIGELFIEASAIVIAIVIFILIVLLCV